MRDGVQESVIATIPRFFGLISLFRHPAIRQENLQIAIFDCQQDG